MSPERDSDSKHDHGDDDEEDDDSKDDNKHLKNTSATSTTPFGIAQSNRVSPTSRKHQGNNFGAISIPL